MTQHYHMDYPVVNDDQQLLGIVTFDDIAKVPPSKRGTMRVEKIARKKLITALPTDSPLDAYKKMIEREIGRILIVNPEDPKRLVGIVTRSDIMHVFMWPMRLK